ncbi:MFS transporter [Anaeroselena agilis]|uniref:MFS transporter n=1 Tax=Anaeroselena agilis TaxID=3063788 RepID=A0ABU3NV38_9FIRM|nr:MFS transporter [Selenomonadales bacterium 4137-cl]
MSNLCGMNKCAGRRAGGNGLMLAALAAGWAVVYADRTALYPLLSVIAGDLALSSTEVGLLTSTYFLLYLVLQIPAGMAGDRWGLKKVLLATYALAGAGVLGLGLAGASYASLLFFVGLHGLGAGGYYPSAYGAMLQAVPPERRGVSAAVVGTGMAAGLLAGLAMSGPVYDWLGSWRAPFLLLSVPTFLMLGFFQAAVPAVRGTETASWREYRAILADRDLWLINIVTFTALYGFWVAVTWGPTFLKLERGFSLGQAGLYTGLVALTALPAGLMWGRLSDRFGRKPLALLVAPGAALTLMALSQVTSAPAIVAALLAFGLFSNSAFTPIMAAWTGDIVSSRYPGAMGAAVGVFNFVVMSAAIVAPTVSGYLRDVTGSLVPAMLAGSALVLAGSALIALLPGRLQGERKQAGP